MKDTSRNMEPSYSLPNYPLRVSYLAGIADGEIFFNHGSEHAKVVLQELFKKAKKNIVLVTGELCDNVYKIEMFQEALDRNIKIKIVHIDTSPRGETFKEIEALSKNNEFLTVENIAEDKKNIVHYCLVDDKHYRMETDAENRTALCAFGADKIAKGENSNKILILLIEFSKNFFSFNVQENSQQGQPSHTEEIPVS